MKNYILIILLGITNLSFAQTSINYNTKTGKLNGFFVKNEVGLFATSSSGHLDYIVLGDVDIMDSVILIASINDTEIYATQLTEISYPTDYFLADELKELPSNINGYSIVYYTDYYDSEYLKGKIKSIGGITLQYYSDYFLNENIKGNIKYIGNMGVTYASNYFQEDILGEITQIGHVEISYNYNSFQKNLHGKIATIGKVRFDYFNDYYNDTHNGELNRITGFDNRFELLTDY